MFQYLPLMPRSERTYHVSSSVRTDENSCMYDFPSATPTMISKYFLLRMLPKRLGKRNLFKRNIGSFRTNTLLIPRFQTSQAFHKQFHAISRDNQWSDSAHFHHWISFLEQASSNCWRSQWGTGSSNALQWLFPLGNLKQHLRGTRFKKENELKLTVVS